MQDTMLDRLLAPEGPKGKVDPLDALIAEDQRRRAIAALGTATNPDAAAKANRLSRDTGVPATTIESNLKFFEGDKNARLWATMIQQNPKLGAWVEQPRNAAVATDDHDAIGKLSGIYDPEAWAARYGTISSAAPGAAAKAPAPGGFLGAVSNVGSSLKAGLFSTSAGVYGVIRMMAENSEAYNPLTWAEKAVFGTSIAEQTRKFAAGQQSVGKSYADASRPNVQNFYAKNLLSGVESVPTTAGAIGLGLMGAPTAAVSFTAGVTTGNAYDQAREAGISPIRATVFAGSQGSIEYVTEKIPLMRLLGDIAAKTPFARTLAHQLATELPQEQVATILQDLNEWAVLHPDKPFVDYLKARPQAALETALATLGGAATNASVGRAFAAAANGVDKVSNARLEADQAQYAADVLDNIAKVSAESKTRGRDPEAYASLLKTLGGDMDDNMYVSGEAVRAYLQSDDGYDQNFWGPLSGQIAEAAATGGDVVIPTADAIAHLSGTKAWDALREDMRITPGGMSLREANQFDGQYEDRIDQAANDTVARIDADLKAAEPRRKLYEAYTQKLMDVGFTPDVARQYAEIATARAATRAVRMGRELTGNELDTTMVNQVLPEGLRPIVAAKNLDMVIATMRRARDPEAKRTTPSLLEWIAKQGGIEDRGGDLKAMGADKWHVGKPGRKKLLRDTNPDQGSMLGEDGQANTNSPDELAVRAQEAGYFLPGERTSIAELIDAIGEELRGKPRYAEDVQPDQMRMAAQELYQLLDQNGVDPTKASDTEIKSFVQRYQDEAGGGRSLDQSYMDGPRGRVTFAEGRNIIDLFEKRDLSTFLHESGHIWLEELKADAESAEASDQVKDDWKTIKAWFKANGHAVGKDGAIPTDAHELWARGVERFTMEGKAPSSGLRKAFEAFRSWLLTIYQVVDNLRAPISPEVRDVMNRMLATDEEIGAAAEEQNVRALFTDAAAAGMTEAEFAAYRATADDARSAAYDALLYRTMVTVRAARTKEYKEQRESVRRDVAENVNNRREFRALAILRDRENGARLDKQWLIDTYGADALDLIPANVPPLFSENGSPADAIAEQAGFQTADEMIRMLMGIETRRKDMRLNGDKRSVRDSVIDEETDAIMSDRYGDPLADGSIEREARELIHNDKQGEVIASELRALSRRRPNLQPTPYQLAKRWAARKVAEGTVSEYTSRSAIQRFQRAARNAGNLAEQAMLKGDIDETFRQKQAQMLNNALVAEATRAADAVDAAVTRLGKVAKRRTMASVDQDYLEQAQALLEQVELRERSQVSIDRQGKFEAWAREREAEGHDVIVPPSFSASLGTTHYTRLSVEQLLGLDDAVKQIMHLGRLKQTLIDGKEAREFDAVVKEAVDAAGKLPPKPPSDLMEPGFADRIKSNVASMDAALLKLETIFDWLDGGNSDGVFNRIAFRPIAEAQDRENAMLADYYGRIKAAMKAVPRDTVRRWSEKIIVPELINRETGNPYVMTRQQLVSMALNMGNEGNVQRLTDGYGWNEAAVREVLNRELSADEWQFVQQVWDTFETLWPDIARMERAINGVEPEKVEAVPLETPHGTFRGGYFPAVYDTAKDLAAEANAGKESDKFGSLYTRATTRASATKERSAKVSRPILLQLGVINRHLGEVIHDITHREAVMQADKFLSSERVMRAVDSSLGPEIRKQFQPWLKFVANSWAMERSGNEGLGKFLNKARANTTAVGMGWRISTIMTQIAGYSNSFEYVGARWVGAAIAQTTANPIKSFNFVMERSAEVRSRMDTLDRDIRLTINQMAGRNTLLSDARRFMFHGIGYADRLVVVPTWIGAYNKALSLGASETDAIYQADKAVRKSQGAGSPKDLAAVQRGTGKWGELLRVSTMFYSYMSAYYQRQRTLGRDIGTAVRERDIRATPKLLARAWWLIVVPPLLSELLAGRGPDDEEDWGYWAFKKMMLNMLGPIPFLRDGTQPFWDSLDGTGAFNYSVTPMQRAGETIFKKVPEDIHKLAIGEDPKRPVQNAMEAAGYVTGLVPGQLATSTQFLVDVGEGEQDPENLQQWYRGLTKGKAEADK